MKAIIQTQDMVFDALINYEKARNSDDYLYFIVCRKKLSQDGIDIDDIAFKDALLKRNHYGLPKFETVRRARQKIQSKFHYLSGSEDVESGRAIKEKQFRQYARR